MSEAKCKCKEPSEVLRCETCGLAIENRLALNIKDEIRKINEQATQIRLITEEIIDCLPQEKEAMVSSCCNSPMRQEPCSNNSGYVYICQKCDRVCISVCSPQPTKEVPDIRGILEKLVGEASFKYNYYARQSIDQAIQEISALYRKDN